MKTALRVLQQQDHARSPASTASGRLRIADRCVDVDDDGRRFARRTFGGRQRILGGLDAARAGHGVGGGDVVSAITI